MVLVVIVVVVVIVLVVVMFLLCLAGDDVFVGGIIGRVHAFDSDKADQLAFAVVRDEDRRLFEIDSIDGTLRVVEGTSVVLIVVLVVCAVFNLWKK